MSIGNDGLASSQRGGRCDLVVDVDDAEDISLLVSLDDAELAAFGQGVRDRAATVTRQDVRPKRRTGRTVPSNQAIDALEWLRTTCARYEFDVVALYRREGEHDWPLAANDPSDLERKLAEGGHFLPLPKEPAALANILEVSIVNFVLERADEEEGLVAVRGTERGYPDIEFSGAALGGAYHAVDVKVARRAKSGTRTQSRITLYTGNTYFRYPTLRWPGTFRPFADYKQHLDVIAVYTLDEEKTTRATDLDLIVEETWRIGSRQRSSTTREYIGAVDSIAALKAGRGEFKTEQEFYDYWRKYRFRIGPSVERVLKKLLADQG